MDWFLFAVFMAACCGAAATGSLFPPDDWYFKDLRKPGWTPPPWLFPLAWTVLYLASAFAAARVAMAGSEGGGAAAGAGAYALAFWSVQIALNTLWTPVFFGLRRLGAAMVVLACLWLAVAATLLSFARVDALAGWLIAPYLVWVSYAGALNFWIWRNNPA